MFFFTFVTSCVFAKAYIGAVINIYVRDKVLKEKKNVSSVMQKSALNYCLMARSFLSHPATRRHGDVSLYVPETSQVHLK